MDARDGGNSRTVLDKLFGPHAANLAAAMTRTTQRHALLSDNLANVNTPGYKRRDVDFGVELDRAQRAAGRKFHVLDDPIQAGESIDQASVRVDGSSVDLEKEVVSMAETELRYQALTDMTGRYFGNLKSVIREGK